MTASPIPRTDRLLPRPFQMSDAPDVQQLAGSYDVAKGTLILPHPYPDGEADRWIADLQREADAGTLVNFAIVLREENRLIGSIGLDIAATHRHARMSYWLGQPYWNRGYCTEAVRALLAYGFRQLHLHRIYASHFLNNPAPHADRKSVKIIIEEARNIARRVDNVKGFTLRLRNLSGIIKMAGDMAATEKKQLIARKDVETAIVESRPIEEKLREKYGNWWSAEVADYGVRTEKTGPETA